MHAALADPARLLITDALAERGRVPLGAGGAARDAVQPARPPPGRAGAGRAGQPPPLGGRPAAHLPAAGTGSRSTRSPGRRRGRRGGCCSCAPPTRRARTWRRRCGGGPARSPPPRPGTHPAAAIDPGAIAAAGRHHLPLRRLRPRHIDEVLPGRGPRGHGVRPGPRGTRRAGGGALVGPRPGAGRRPGSFDAALADLGQRVGRLAPASCPLPARRRLSAGERDPRCGRGWPTARGEPGRTRGSRDRSDECLGLCRQPAGPATRAGQRLALAARSAAEGGADAASAAPAAAAAARMANRAG